MATRNGILVIALLGALPLLSCGGGGGSAEPPFAQTLLTVEPSIGAVDGGTVITLTGFGFTDPMHTIRVIRFDEIHSENWTILDDRTIVVESPPGALGTVSIDLIGDNPPQGDGILLTRSFTYVAARLFLADGAGAADPGLHAFDVATGAVSRIGSIGHPIRAMAMGPDNVLYGVEDASPQRLLRIDPITGAGTRLLTLAIGAQPIEVVDLAYAGSRLFGWRPNDEIVEIDPTPGGNGVTASADVPGAPGGGALASVDADFLHLLPGAVVQRLDRLELATGLVTPGPGLSRSISVRAAARRVDRLYAIEEGRPGGSPVELLRIAPANGALLTVGPLPATIRALARDF